MKKLFLIVLTLFSLSMTSKAQVLEKAEDYRKDLKGSKLPTATLRDCKNNGVNLLETIAQKPTVLVFYRGGWCPYCNTQLAGLAKVEQDILEAGYQIIGISPDSYENLCVTSEKQDLSYQLLADTEGQLIQALGIAFKTPEGAKGYIAKNTIGAPSAVLPVPTVLIVDKSGEILFQYSDPDYKKRVASEDILLTLEELKTRK